MHFHRDLDAVAQLGAMHLAQGSCGEWLLLELGECLGQAYAELLGDDALDIGKGKWTDVILEPRERLQVARGEKIAARREKLAELDEGRPHGLEIVGEFLGGGIGRQILGVGDRVQTVPVRGGGIQLGGLRLEVPAAIAEEETRDLLVALEMLTLEGDRHEGFTSSFPKGLEPRAS